MPDTEIQPKETVPSAMFDTKKTMFDETLTTMYYYLVPKSDMLASQTKDEVTIPIGYNGHAIQSISYHPFLEKSNITTWRVNMDKTGLKYEESVLYPYLYRITSLETRTIPLGSATFGYDAYPYNYEAKTLLFPYRYFVLTDYINPPLLIKPQLLQSGQMSFKVRYGMSTTSKYTMFLDGYKGDSSGNLEGVVNCSPFLMPVTSNAYQSFMATSGQTFEANKQAVYMQNQAEAKQMNTSAITSLIQTLASLGLGVATGGSSLAMNALALSASASLMGQSTQLISSAAGRRAKEMIVEKQALATESDLLNTPNSVMSSGNDCIFTLSNAGYKIDLIEYTVTPSRLMRISNFFVRYGVQTMNYGIPNFKTRRYFNYIKTSNCNVDSDAIPHNDLRQIEEIFNSGITFWHIDNGARIKDYYVENTPI